MPPTSPAARPAVNVTVREKSTLANAERCSRHLEAFATSAWKIVEPGRQMATGWFFRAMCKLLEDWARHKTKPNVLFNVPPATMKSTLCSVFFPAWVWTWNPSARFYYVSYDGKLSTRDSIRTRQVILSDWYQRRWWDVFKLTGDQNQKTKFQNTRQGWRESTSVSGGLTGGHPDFLFIDDPHNAKKAESETERQSVIDWWTGTVATRGVTRDVRRGLIMQRLHVNDLSGYILKNEPDEWDKVILPMRYEPDRMVPVSNGFMDPRRKPGELLWPDLYPRHIVVSTETRMGSLVTAGQFQQRPVPAGGVLFHRQDFQTATALPWKCNCFVRYWDKAASPDEGSDFSAGVLMAQHGGQFFVINVVRGQWTSWQRNKTIRATAEDDHRRYGTVIQWVETEGGSAGKESTEISVRELAGFPVHGERPTGSKWDRALPLAAQVEAGNVYLLIPAGTNPAWVQPYIDEMIEFPNGSNDDQVDGSSGAFNKLAVGRLFGKPEAASAKSHTLKPRKGLSHQGLGKRFQYREGLGG